MAKKKTTVLHCPTCNKIVLATEPDFPFCSERCRTIDLGKWISGGYVISTPLNDPESGGETEYNRERRSSPERTQISQGHDHVRKPN